MKEKISIVIPCYNSSQTLPLVITEIKNTMMEHDYSNYEIILVNDCSKDTTWDIIKQLSHRDSRIKGIELAKNFGQHAALMAGFHYVEGDIVVCMDDDGQTPANEIFKLVNKINNSVDVVYALYKDKQHSRIRNIGSKINDLMAYTLLNKPKSLYLSSYFAMKRYVVNTILVYNNPYPYIIGLILQTTNKIVNVEINHRERKLGNSGYTIKKLISLWINGFTSFSVKPLRLATLIGFIFAFIGAIYTIYTVFKKIINPWVPLGWSSLISATLITNGVILLVLGLVGEYLGRIFISINNIPQFVIRDGVGIDDKKIFEKK